MDNMDQSFKLHTQKSFVEVAERLVSLEKRLAMLIDLVQRQQNAIIGAIEVLNRITANSSSDKSYKSNSQ